MSGIEGEYDYNETWTPCPGIMIKEPDLSIPLMPGTPGFKAWGLAVTKSLRTLGGGAGG